MIVGWRVAGHMRTPMVLDAIEMARWNRGLQHPGLRCHSDAGSQFTSIRYGERLAEIGAVPSIGTVGDSYDNALAETVNGYYKAELIRGPARQGPWKTVEEVELATLGWVHWHNTQRLHGYLGDLPPAEFEQHHAAQTAREDPDPEDLPVGSVAARAADRLPERQPQPEHAPIAAVDPDHRRLAAPTNRTGSLNNINNENDTNNSDYAATRPARSWPEIKTPEPPSHPGRFNPRVGDQPAASRDRRAARRVTVARLCSGADRIRS